MSVLESRHMVKISTSAAFGFRPRSKLCNHHLLQVRTEPTLGLECPHNWSLHTTVSLELFGFAWQVGGVTASPLDAFQPWSP